mmetsp:Transcript_41317/g.74703  ORF Transcript_41317/g.74703 Transcript_41317/m.74703 type:complete len:397 (-) Transcript_41317:83-1273(-)
MVTVDQQTRLREPGFASKGKRLARSSSRGDDGSLPPIREGQASRDGSLQQRDALGRGGQQRSGRSQSRGPPLGAESGARDNSLPPLMRPQPAAEVVTKPPRRLPHKVESSGRPYPDAATPPRYATGQPRAAPSRQPAEVVKAPAESIAAEPARQQPPVQSQRRSAGTSGDGSRGRARQPPFAVEHDSPTTRTQAPPRPNAGANADGPLSRPAAPVGVDEVGGSDQLLACPHCARTFNAKAHAKHVPLCVKVFEKSRKTFKAVEQRMPKEAIQASRQAQRGQRTKGPTKAAATAGPGSDKLNTKWKQQSEAFRAAIKDARVVEQYRREGKSLSNLPQPRQTPAELDDRVPCPHCGRRFGQQQAERHIPHCAKAKVRPNPPPRAPQAAGSQQRQPNRR